MPDISIRISDEDWKRLSVGAKAANMSVPDFLLAGALDKAPSWPSALQMLFDELVVLGHRMKLVIEGMNGEDRVDALETLSRASELMDMVWNMIEKKSGFGS